MLSKRQPGGKSPNYTNPKGGGNQFRAEIMFAQINLVFRNLSIYRPSICMTIKEPKRHKYWPKTKRNHAVVI